jgi:hypothetical protein
MRDVHPDRSRRDDRFWREADVRHNGQVGYLAAPALLFLETSTLTGTP